MTISLSPSTFHPFAHSLRLPARCFRGSLTTSGARSRGASRSFFLAPEAFSSGRRASSSIAECDERLTSSAARLSGDCLGAQDAPLDGVLSPRAGFPSGSLKGAAPLGVVVPERKETTG